MPITYDIDADGVVTTTLSGFVDRTAYLAHPQELAADDRIVWPLREVFDTREMSGTDVLGQDIRANATPSPQVMATLKQARIAIIVKSELSYGLGRMFQTMSSMVDAGVLVTENADAAQQFVRLSNKESIN